MKKKSIYTKRSIRLGKWIREQRMKAGYSTRGFETYSGWSDTTIGNIERGERRLDVVEFLELCEYLDCDPYEAIDLLLEI